ncbi:MAG: glycerol-3-phosphate 1-O-acyltransferase PlsY [Gammaproteobacteria bacterium]|nr:glycerol-3-phosphate 1-O-acyltransferase PlsY [Gammaproteobacteria bacterium]MDH3935272.1 glycerol-3-phosphate 1-O-acyltransferase PlsY [Gammaproteobacteria bacterium]MDH3985033.1 glycerol-3-phosphate 1-O-acyltransferase PlsY [Gammaproteobacteria bacterium]
MTIDYLLIPAGYLFGSISTAIIVCKLMGLPDPRTEGSGNPGATNVARLGGKKAAALTLLGDMLKGLIPVLIAHAMQAAPLILAATALAAFLGHLYPVFFGFRGGKGVATALGVIYGLDWHVGLLTTAIWLAMALLFRYSSLAALIAILLAPLGFLWLWPQPAVIAAMAIMTVMLYWRHRSNISNLLSGREGKISFGKGKK